MSNARIAVLTSLTMIAFAGNSVLCRIALEHTRIDAATVQLSVPVLAALGGVAFLGEPITLRLALASVAILGGIALVIRQRSLG